jgi:XTP/dITP diphosphohydrolase
LELSLFFFIFASIMEQKHTREEKLEAFGRLLDVMDRLRTECPWDRKQTNESLRPNTIEEAYELSDAILKDDHYEICKELGDVLLHIVFYSRIGEEKAQFDIADVCNKLCDKMIFRHPHVYGDVVAKNAEEVLDNWEQIKQKEKGGNKTVLGGVPASLPSVIKAYRIQDKARHVGFDWEDKQDVWAKVREELDELETELKREDKQRSEKELGDFIFSVINAARLYKLNPDNALEMTNQKFISRFNYIEQHSIKSGKPLTEMSLEEMDKLWNEAKNNEK